jgi:beta-glucosidase
VQCDYARGYVGDTVQSYNGVTVGRSIAETRSSEELLAEAVEKAKGADYVIVFGGLNKSNYQDCEGHDRQQYGLPYAQDQLLEALAKVNKNLVYVNISGNGVAMPWVKSVPAIMQGWFIGSEAGEALASVLVGDANPSGKLPFTWYQRLDDCGAHALNAFPGVWRDDYKIIDEEYKEGIYVGYRWTDKQKIRPLFAFGHGLSYTTFKLGKLMADKQQLSAGGQISFTVNVTNTGSRAGSETVQLYISDKQCSVDRPVKELKAFQKVFLQPGESQDVTLTIGCDALSFYNEAKGEWTAEPGAFEALVGTASDNLTGKITFELQ